MQRNMMIASLLAGAVALPAVQAFAGVVYADPADGEVWIWNNDPLPQDGGGTVGNTTNDSVFIGQTSKGTTDENGYQAYVMPFQLPSLGNVANPFTAASFTSYSNGDEGYTYRNLSLYALGARDTAAIGAADFHTGGGTDSTDASQLGQFRYVGEGPPASGTESTFSDSSLLNYLNAQYADGAGAGKYVFLRLEMEGGNGWWHGFRQRTADYAGTNFDPRIDYTAVPEPTAAGLIGLGALALRRRRRA